MRTRHSTHFALLLVLTIFLSVGPVQASPAQPGYTSQETRTLFFAGIPWGVRTGFGSPGPNHYSPENASVRVDSSGRLHLKIKNYNGTWYSAEVFSLVNAQYGDYRFYIDKASPTLDKIDPNLVLGLFLFKAGCGANCESEVDIEITRWRNPLAVNNAQYTAQPARIPGNLHAFPLALNTPFSTHTMRWQPGSVIFQSYMEHNPYSPTARLQTWTYRGNYVPRQSDKMVVVLDYWMDGGVPPTNGLEDEIIITDADIAGICRPVENLVCGASVPGSTNEAGSRSQIHDYDIVPWLEAGREFAYTFTPDVSGPVHITVDSLTDLDVFVLQDPGRVCSAENSLAYGNRTASFQAQAGTRYYVVVDGFIGGTGNYHLSVDCSGGPPPEDPEKQEWPLYLPMAQRLKSEIVWRTTAQKMQ